MLANLLHVAGVKHVITVDLHASQMQGFFKCPVDNLHAEPIIAKWIKRNVPEWREAVVVSKNAGGTKRVTSLADAMKLNFGIITTDRRRPGKVGLSTSAIMAHFDGVDHHHAMELRGSRRKDEVDDQPAFTEKSVTSPAPAPAPNSTPTLKTAADVTPKPTENPNENESKTKSLIRRESDYDDRRAQEVIQGRLVRGHIVEDDEPSPARSVAEGSSQGDDVTNLSQASSFFAPDRQTLGASAEDATSSEEEDNALQNPESEHMITLVGNVKNRTVFIVDDMIDKPGSWIAAAETVVKKGGAKKVYCIATHGVFGGDCLEQLQACECINTVVVTNSFPYQC